MKVGKLATPRILRFVTLVLLAGSLLAVSACSRYSLIESQLKENQQKWSAQKIADYNYTLEISAFAGTLPVIVKVRNGVTQSVTYLHNGKPATQEIFNTCNTVDKLFATIKDAIEQKAHEITVKYDSTLGYPKRIYIDLVEAVVDEEIEYTVSDFQVIR